MLGVQAGGQDEAVNRRAAGVFCSFLAYCVTVPSTIGVTA